MNEVIARGFNLKAIEILHAELSRMLEQNTLLEGNAKEVFHLTKWGRNFVQDMIAFLGHGDTAQLDFAKSRLDWSKLLNPLFLMLCTKTRIYFKKELVGLELK